MTALQLLFYGHFGFLSRGRQEGNFYVAWRDKLIYFEVF